MKSGTRTERRATIFPQFQQNKPDRKGGRSLPRVRTRSKGSGQKGDNFNKYYIHPDLRYKSKQENPKNNPSNYDDDTFIYKNLHNLNFWNWVHPLDDYELKRPANLNTISAKVNRGVLQKFNNYIQSRNGKRLPLMIQEILHQQM